MDSPLATHVFKRLFGTCFRRAALHDYRRRTIHARTPSSRAYGTYRDMARGQARPRAAHDRFKMPQDYGWEIRKLELSAEELGPFSDYGYTTAEELRHKSRRPRRLKMTMRDFIEDSLYNPAYGYFSTQATIFNAGKPFDFNAMRDEPAFYRALEERYKEFEDELDSKDFNETRQLWHTPTELFRPYYAEAMARYFVDTYMIAFYPYTDLIIYEMGAGNGTFMMNVLDYIRRVAPEVYTRTQYKIIEISPALADIQSSKLIATAGSRGHADKVEIINRSIFEWNTYVSSPCFFVALEVFDNFGHDVVRYDLQTAQPLQGTVLIDTEGEMYEFYTPKLDRTLSRFLRVRNAARPGLHPTPEQMTRRRGRWSWLREFFVGPDELSGREYLPTKLMQFFEVLNTYFPGHKLICSDFHSLPDATEGINAPVVQTRYQRTTVPVSTPLVRQGYFDILFPTDFVAMEHMYRAITGKLTRVSSHESFMRSWANIERTETMNMENPLLSHYKNASFMTTV